MRWTDFVGTELISKNQMTDDANRFITQFPYWHPTHTQNLKHTFMQIFLMPGCTCTSCESVLHKKSFSLFNSSGLKLKNKWICIVKMSADRENPSNILSYSLNFHFCYDPLWLNVFMHTFLFTRSKGHGSGCTTASAECTAIFTACIV